MLALMRKFSRKRNIVRPGVKRFASSFLTLQSILEKEEKLKYMFLSKERGECKWPTKSKDKEVIGRDAKCMAAVITCIEAFFPDNYDLQDLVGNVELLKYKNMEGMFGKKLAIMGRTRNEDNFNKVGWWSNYGAETPNLQKMALKIVSLTSSSPGCERN